MLGAEGVVWEVVSRGCVVGVSGVGCVFVGFLFLSASVFVGVSCACSCLRLSLVVSPSL